MEGGGIQSELDELAAVLGRSVSLDAPDGTLLGYSTQGADVDPVRVQAILSRRVPDAVLAYQRGHGIDTATGPVRLPANAGLGMSARTCVPVHDRRRVVALLWILDDDGPLDSRAAQACATRLAALLRPTPAPELDRLLAELSTDRPRPDVVARLVQRAALVPSRMVRFAARDRRRLLLVDRDEPAADGEVVGYSRPFRAGDADPAVVSTLAARAIVAADCATADPALPRTLGWDDLGVYRRLLLTTDPAGWAGPLPVAADDRSAGMLRHTMEVYLDNAGDAARTIAALRIHRTTFYYRLDRLSTVHGIRLDDGLTRTDLHLALKAHRLARARETHGWTDRFLARLR